VIYLPATSIQQKKMAELEFGSGNPAIHYLGISLTNPLQTGTGVVEPLVADGYARVAITNNSTNWTTYSNGYLSNNIAFEFPECINNNWNTLEQPLYLFLATSISGKGDDIKYYTELTGSDKKLIQTGTVLKVPVEQFKVTGFDYNG